MEKWIKSGLRSCSAPFFTLWKHTTGIYCLWNTFSLWGTKLLIFKSYISSTQAGKYLTHKNLFWVEYHFRLFEQSLLMKAVLLIYQSIISNREQWRWSKGLSAPQLWQEEEDESWSFSTQESSIIIARCFTEFYFYQHLGHLTLVTLYETVPHIVGKDPQWFAHFFVLYFVKKER